MKNFFSLFSILALLSSFTFVSCSKDDDIIDPEITEAVTAQVEDLMPPLWCDKTFIKDSLLIFVNMAEDKSFTMTFVLRKGGELHSEIMKGTWKPFVEKNKDEIRGGGLWSFGNETTGIVEGKVYLQQDDKFDIRLLSSNSNGVNVFYYYDKILEAIDIATVSGTRYSWSEFWDDVKSVVKTTGKVIACNPVTKTVVDWTDTFFSTVGQGVLSITGKLDQYAIYGLDKWMKELPDNAKICDLSIPGTHDTFTFDARVTAIYSLTQLMNIAGQWNAGVRMFDVRINTNNYKTCHDKFVDFCTLDEALEAVEKQLTAHSSETAIMVMKIDYGPSKDSEKRVINDKIKKAFGDKIADWKPDMTLGEARGKVIIIYRYSFDDNNLKNEALGPSLSDYGDKNNANQTIFIYKNSKKTEAPLLVQDHYSRDGYISTDNEYWYQKQYLMKQNFFFAADSKEHFPMENKWYFNHTSGFVGTGASMNYARNAEEMNPFANNYINNHLGEKTGIIVMDFAGADIAYDGSYTKCADLPITVVKNCYKLYGMNFDGGIKKKLE